MIVLTYITYNRNIDDISVIIVPQLNDQIRKTDGYWRRIIEKCNVTYLMVHLPIRSVI
jgi:hypothetical protein